MKLKKKLTVTDKQKLINQYTTDLVVNRCLQLLVLYREKSRSNGFDSFESFMEDMIKEIYGPEKFEAEYKRLVKKINKN